MSEVAKEFKLSTWSVKNKISVYVMVVIVVVLGMVAYKTMPKESFPEVKLPTMYINVAYPGNSPLDMENLVTRPIEKEVNGINGITKLTSTSIQDFSIIIAEFNFDIESSEALQKVKDAVDRAKAELPSDLPADPNVMELNFSDFPVMNVNVSGNYSQEELKEYAEKLQDDIENIPEVSKVDLTGLTDEEVQISIDRVKMEALEITLGDVENAIRGENVTMSGGDILSISGDDRTRRNIRIDGEFKSWNEIKDVIIKNEFQNIVYLRDIGEVSFGQKEPTSYARLDGNPVVTLDVVKANGANLLSAADKINAIIEHNMKHSFPSDLKVTVTNDQSKDTRSLVSELENSIIMGVILVVLVLIFFLGLRNSMFVGIAIPISMLLGIAILNFGGNTLNMMVLFSLILALGMLVDNGIVVVENIYRLRTEEGKDNETASVRGVGEVAIPIIASTATTLAAFLPLLIWPGMMGEFMKFLPLTLIIVLASSLFVALVINPVLTANLMKDNTPGKKGTEKKFWIRMAVILVLGILFALSPKSRLIGGLFITGFVLSVLNRYVLKPGGDYFMANIMPRLEDFYARSARFALRKRNPMFFFLGTCFLMILSIIFFGMSNPQIVFFPDNQPRYVNIFIEAPLGTDIEKTDSITKILEHKVSEALKPYRAGVEAVLAQVGEKTSDPNSGSPEMGPSPHKAKIVVSFIEFKNRVFMKDIPSSSELMKIIKDACGNPPEVRLTFAKDANGPPMGKPINLEIMGNDYLKLIELVEDVKKRMEDEDIKGVDQLQTDLELGKPMLEVHIDREAARRFGLSTYNIAGTIRTALLGKEISKYKDGEDDFEINLRFTEDYRYNLGDLMNTKITFRNMADGKIVQVPISAVANISYNSTYGSVKRKDTRRVISIFSEVEEGANANEIVAEFEKLLADYDMPEGYTYKFTGQQAEQEDTSSFLVGALLLAVFLIFLIIVTQFNSIIGPAIIMFSVLFSTIGVFLGFGLTHMPFSILMSGIGIVSLAGIVVNNAIVLVDYTILLRERKRAAYGIGPNELLSKEDIVETIVEGGRTRLRPVLLTAITTVLGLIPLAVGMNIDFQSLLTTFDPQFYLGGQNADFWAPMAWTIIFGLVFATFLTLIIVPVMYYLSDSATIKFKQMFGKDLKTADYAKDDSESLISE
ncbi:MAG: efflux RND transporter permease subunit [Bacteroidia bacterium]